MVARGEAARRHAPGHRGDERRHVPLGERLAGGGRRRLQLPAEPVRHVPRAPSRQAADQLRGHLGVHDPRRIRTPTWSATSCRSYDDDTASWGATHRAAWKAIAERPFVAGGFVWTGFDYRGEPSPFEWPSARFVLRHHGLCRFPEDRLLHPPGQWIDDSAGAQLVPHWNWPGREGEPIKVMALTQCRPRRAHPQRQADRRAGGRSLRDGVAGRCRTRPGRLEAVALQGRPRGRARCRRDHRRAGALRLVPDRDCAGRRRPRRAAGHRARAGRAGPRRCRPPICRCKFRIEGGDIIGLGNGDPNSHEPEKGDRRSLFNGLAQVIVRSREGGRGALKLHASAPGVAAAQTAIDLRATPAPPSVARTHPYQQLQDWRMSPASDAAPDPARAARRQRHELLGLASFGRSQRVRRRTVASVPHALHAACRRAPQRRPAGVQAPARPRRGLGGRRAAWTQILLRGR